MIVLELQLTEPVCGVQTVHNATGCTTQRVLSDGTSPWVTGGHGWWVMGIVDNKANYG